MSSTDISRIVDLMDSYSPMRSEPQPGMPKRTVELTDGRKVTGAYWQYGSGQEGDIDTIRDQMTLEEISRAKGFAAELIDGKRDRITMIVGSSDDVRSVQFTLA